MQLDFTVEIADRCPTLAAVALAAGATLDHDLGHAQEGRTADPFHDRRVKPFDAAGLLGDRRLRAAVGRQASQVQLVGNRAGFAQATRHDFGARVFGQISLILQAGLFQRPAIQTGRQARHAGGQEVRAMRPQAGQRLAVVIVRAVLAIAGHVAPVVIGHAHRNHQAVTEFVQFLVGEVALDLIDILEAGRFGLGIQAIAQCFPAGRVIVNLGLHAQEGLVSHGQLRIVAAVRMRAAHLGIRLRIGGHRAADFVRPVHEITVQAGVAQRIVRRVAQIPVPTVVAVARDLVETADDVQRGIGELFAGAEGQRHITQLEGLHRHRGLFFQGR